MKMNNNRITMLAVAVTMSLAGCLVSIPVSARSLTVTAGGLQDLFNSYSLMNESNLTLSGTINGSDVIVLRKWANQKRVLNLANCRIVAGGEPYYEDYTTEDDIIGSYMFGDKSFKTLVLPNTLTKIGDYALSYCGEEIDFPSTLSWLGDHAFTNNKFKKLHIPATLLHIGNGALNGNIALSDVTIDEGHPSFVLEDGYLFTRDHTRLISYFAPIGSRAESFTIRHEVTVIDDKAFNYHRCNNITLNERLEYIGENAFKYALNNIAPHQPKLVIPNTVTHIGTSAFEYCYMDSVIISDNVEYLRENTFNQCCIYYIHLPAKLRLVGRMALYNNSMYNLEELPDGLETVGEYAFYNMNSEKLVIPASMRQMDCFAFDFVLADTIEIKAPLDSIPMGAFYSCQGLVKLVLPPTIKRIGQSAFYECYQLKECHLPDGLEEIGSWALAGADYMKEWHIPATVRKIERAAFAVPNFSSHTVYMYSKEPPAETDLQAFKDWTMAKSVLYVPEGSLEQYQQTAPWSYFGSIREFEASSIKSTRVHNRGQVVNYFDLQGRPVNPDAPIPRIVVNSEGKKYRLRPVK